MPALLDKCCLQVQCLGRADLGEASSNTDTTPCSVPHYLCCSLLCSGARWREEKPNPQFLCYCSGKEWLGISEIATALTILVAGIVPSGRHAYIQSRKILIVYYIAQLFRSSCFPCKKLREDAKQGRNIKGPFPWTPLVGWSSCFMIPPFPQENSESRNLV